MNIFLNTAYKNIELFVFNKNYQKLYTEESQNNHTIILYELFERMLKAEQITADDIDKIYVITGPGSYTGTRVGVVAAKTFAYIKKIPIIPVNLLQITYLTNLKPVALDARGRKYFTYDGKKFEILAEENILNYQKDIRIKYENILKNDNLDNFQEKDVFEIKIDYMKEAI